MNIKSLIILIVIFAGLFAFIHFHERYTQSTDERSAQSKNIFSFAEQEIESITISHTVNNQLFTLKKNNESGIWHFDKKGEPRANGQEIQSLLTDLRFIDYSRQLDHKSFDMASVGLDTPSMTIQFSDGKTIRRLETGAPTAVGNKVYCAAYTGPDTKELNPDQKSVYVVDDMITRTLDLSFDQLRSKRVMPKLSFVPSTIRIERGELSIVMEKGNENRWFITEPIYRKADDERIHELNVAFEHLPIVDYVSDSDEPHPLTKYGLDEPRLTMTMQSESDSRSIMVGSEYNNDLRSYVMNSIESNVYGVENKHAALFFSTLFDLSTKQLLLLENQDIRAVQIESPESEFRIERENDSWWIQSPVQVKAATDSVYELFSTLRSFKVTDYILEPELMQSLQQKSQHTYTVIITPVRTDQDEVTLRVFHDSETNRLFLQKNQTEAFCEVSIDREPFLPLFAWDLADRDILHLNRHIIEKVRFTVNGLSGTFLQRAGEMLANGSVLNDNDQEQVFTVLHGINVEQMVTEKTDASIRKFGLDTPYIELHVTFTTPPLGGQKHIDVYFTRQKEDGQVYGYMKSYPLIFTVEPLNFHAVEQVLNKFAVSGETD